MNTGERRQLIVNADDLGFSPGVNEGILRAHRYGIVTSASLMVRWPAATAAARLAKEHPSLDLGLHVDLEEWAYRDGDWARTYAVLSEETRVDGRQVADEVVRQLTRFRDLTGHDPSHLDSHQHVHREEPMRSVLIELATQLGVPLRHFDPRIQYCGEFYGQSGRGEPYPEGIKVGSLCRIIRELPPGISELCCHPGIGQDHASSYAIERERECAALCDPQVRLTASAAGIEFISFAWMTERKR